MDQQAGLDSVEGEACEARYPPYLPLYQDVKNRDVEPHGVGNQNNVGAIDEAAILP